MKMAGLGKLERRGVCMFVALSRSPLVWIVQKINLLVMFVFACCLSHLTIIDLSSLSRRSTVPTYC